MVWEWIIFGILIGVLKLVWEVRKYSRLEESVDSIEKKIQGLIDFDAADYYISDISLTGVAVDQGRREFLLVDESSLRRFPLSSVISCEIREDGVELASANRGSRLAGMALGGVVAGGVGALIGGLYGSQRIDSNVEKLVLRFVTDDFHRPNHDIVLLDWSREKNGGDRDNPYYREMLETAELWHGRVMAMMKAGD